MEKMLAAFLKSLGLTPDYIQDKMNEFAAIVKAYDTRLARVEANQMEILNLLRDKKTVIPIEKPVNGEFDGLRGSLLDLKAN